MNDAFPMGGSATAPCITEVLSFANLPGRARFQAGSAQSGKEGTSRESKDGVQSNEAKVVHSGLGSSGEELPLAEDLAFTLAVINRYFFLFFKKNRHLGSEDIFSH